MNTFVIGKTEFGVGEVEVEYYTELQGMSVRIYGDEAKFEESSAEGEEWEWALYPPNLYFMGIPHDKDKGTQFDIDDAILDDYDIALYFSEHNDIFGHLSISSEGIFQFEGTVDLFGERETLFVRLSLKK